MFYSLQPDVNNFSRREEILLGYRAFHVTPFKTFGPVDRFSWNLVWTLCHWACPKAVFFKFPKIIFETYMYTFVNKTRDY